MDCNLSSKLVVVLGWKSMHYANNNGNMYHGNGNGRCIIVTTMETCTMAIITETCTTATISCIEATRNKRHGNDINFYGFVL